MSKRFYALAIVLLALFVGVALPLAAQAGPTATVALRPGSDCYGGTLNISVTGGSGEREYGRATNAATGEILGEFESSGPGADYTGAYGFPFDDVQPSGTIVTLYGYMGSTPPSADTTAEFTVTYNCSTGEVLASCAGPYGTCSVTPAGFCPNVRDGRLNNSTALDCAAPIVLYDAEGGLDVWGLDDEGHGVLLFQISDDALVPGSRDVVLQQATNPGTGHQVQATLLSDGSLLLQAHYADGKPYTLIYNPSASPVVTHISW